MIKIFLDSDIIIDFLSGREPFSDSIKDIFQAAISKRVELYVSSITIVNTSYIIGRFENQKSAKSKIKKLLTLVTVLNVGQSVVDQAIQSKFKDFEDGVQNYCAAKAGLNIIVTRNVKDFKESDLSVLTPNEFLSRLNPGHRA